MFPLRAILFLTLIWLIACYAMSCLFFGTLQPWRSITPDNLFPVIIAALLIFALILAFWIWLCQSFDDID